MPALISAATASLSLSTGLPATATPITTMLRVTLKSDRNAAGPLMRLASSGATNWQQVGIGADGVALVGVAYPVACHVVTAAGREDDRTLLITIRER